MVMYFDKTRMEITHPDGDMGSIWYVTNGLLAKELVTGQLQLGDNTFESHPPAQVNVAGDASDPNGPTYASFNKLLGYGAIPSGWIITQTVDRAGNVGADPNLASYNVTAQDVGALTKHSVASVFWDFMNSSGLVSLKEQDVQDKLFQNPFYATGYPLTEPYWTNVLVGSVQKQVLVQVFERRVLTYTPSNPDGWKVEAGNVGQQYQQWRYHDLQKPRVIAGDWVTPMVSDLTPSQNETVTVSVLVQTDGQPAAGIPMTATWHYKTTTATCSGVSGDNGIASCSRDFSDATIGYPVRIDMVTTLNGSTWTSSMTITPQ
jgi:hypothetical protein